MKKSILILGLGVFLISCEGESVVESTEEENKKEVYSVVTAVNAEQDIFEHYIKVQGTVEAGKMSMVTPEAGGVITSLKVEGMEGSFIKKGATIAVFDSKTLSSNIEELNIQIALAETMYKKQKSLYDQGLGNIIQLDQTKGQLEALKQSKKTVGTQKSKFVLSAPFDGIIEKVYVVQGQVAGPGSPIIMLVGKNERKVIASISETYLKDVNQGAEVELDFPALDITMSNLTVTRVGGLIDPVNRTVDIEVNIPSDQMNDKLVPNLMANIKIRDKVDSSAVMVPSKVILKGANKSNYVYVMSSNQESSNDTIMRYSIKKTEVIKGDMYDGKTIVLSGLSGNEMVVNRGRADVDESSIVELIKEN